MKILILTTTAVTDATGGVERFSFYLLKACSEYDTALIGVESFSPIQKKIYTLARLSGLGQPVLGYLLGRNALHKGADLFITNGLLGWNINTKNSINIQHSTFAKAAIRVDKKKNFFKYLMKRYVWGYFEKKAAQHAQRVVAVSNETKESVERFYNTKQVVVIPNAVDTALFAPGDKVIARTKMGLQQDKTIVLFVGRFEQPKGKGILEEMGQYLSQHQGRLIVAEHYTQSELATLYAAADFFIFPSLHEGCSYALLEAMSSGLLFLASPVGSVADFEREGLFSGCIVKDQNTAAYIEALERLRTLPNPEREMLQQKIRSYILFRHSITAFNDSYKKLIKTCL